MNFMSNIRVWIVRICISHALYSHYILQRPRYIWSSYLGYFVHHILFDCRITLVEAKTSHSVSPAMRFQLAYIIVQFILLYSSSASESTSNCNVSLSLLNAIDKHETLCDLRFHYNVTKTAIASFYLHPVVLNVHFG